MYFILVINFYVDFIKKQTTHGFYGKKNSHFNLISLEDWIINEKINIIFSTYNILLSSENVKKKYSSLINTSNNRQTFMKFYLQCIE